MTNFSGLKSEFLISDTLSDFSKTLIFFHPLIQKSHIYFFFLLYICTWTYILLLGHQRTIHNKESAFSPIVSLFKSESSSYFFIIIKWIPRFLVLIFFARLDHLLFVLKYFDTFLTSSVLMCKRALSEFSLSIFSDFFPCM